METGSLEESSLYKKANCFNSWTRWEYSCLTLKLFIQPLFVPAGSEGGELIPAAVIRWEISPTMTLWHPSKMSNVHQHPSERQAAWPPLERAERFLTVSRWVRWCFARSLELLNAFWQPGCWHRYGFSPVWLLRCIFRFSRREKALLQPSNCGGGEEALQHSGRMNSFKRA